MKIKDWKELKKIFTTIKPATKKLHNITPEERKKAQHKDSYHYKKNSGMCISGGCRQQALTPNVHCSYHLVKRQTCDRERYQKIHQTIRNKT